MQDATTLKAEQNKAIKSKGHTSKHKRRQRMKGDEKG